MRETPDWLFTFGPGDEASPDDTKAREALTRLATARADLEIATGHPSGLAPTWGDLVRAAGAAGSSQSAIAAASGLSLAGVRVFLGRPLAP